QPHKDLTARPTDGMASPYCDGRNVVDQHSHLGVTTNVRVDVVRAEAEHIIAGVGERDIGLLGCAGRKRCRPTTSWEAVVAAVIDARHRPPVCQHPPGHTIVGGCSSEREGVTTID